LIQTVSGSAQPFSLATWWRPTLLTLTGNGVVAVSTRGAFPDRVDSIASSPDWSESQPFVEHPGSALGSGRMVGREGRHFQRAPIAERRVD
jgi:hypothetical protein